MPHDKAVRSAELFAPRSHSALPPARRGARGRKRARRERRAGDDERLRRRAGAPHAGAGAHAGAGGRRRQRGRGRGHRRGAARRRHDAGRTLRLARRPGDRRPDHPAAHARRRRRRAGHRRPVPGDGRPHRPARRRVPPAGGGVGIARRGAGRDAIAAGAWSGDRGRTACATRSPTIRRSSASRSTRWSKRAACACSCTSWGCEPLVRGDRASIGVDRAGEVGPRRHSRRRRHRRDRRRRRVRRRRRAFRAREGAAVAVVPHGRRRGPAGGARRGRLVLPHDGRRPGADAVGRHRAHHPQDRCDRSRPTSRWPRSNAARW